MDDKYTYQKARCCNVDCYYCNTLNEPCWGEVEVDTEDGFDSYLEDTRWIHACKGHAGVFDGEEKYKPKPE